jgi:hypothetical protein
MSLCGTTCCASGNCQAGNVCCASADFCQTSGQCCNGPCQFKGTDHEVCCANTTRGCDDDNVSPTAANACCPSGTACRNDTNANFADDFCCSDAQYETHAVGCCSLTTDNGGNTGVEVAHNNGPADYCCAANVASCDDSGKCCTGTAAQCYNGLNGDPSDDLCCIPDSRLCSDHKKCCNAGQVCYTDPNPMNDLCCAVGQVIHGGACCTPTCPVSSVCGASDGCGGKCDGSCIEAGTVCKNGACVPDVCTPACGCGQFCANGACQDYCQAGQTLCGCTACCDGGQVCTIDATGPHCIRP